MQANLIVDAWVIEKISAKPAELPEMSDEERRLARHSRAAPRTRALGDLS